MLLSKDVEGVREKNRKKLQRYKMKTKTDLYAEGLTHSMMFEMI